MKYARAFLCCLALLASLTVAVQAQVRTLSLGGTANELVLTVRSGPNYAIASRWVSSPRWTWRRVRARSRA